MKGRRLKSYPVLITSRRFILAEEIQRGACGGLRPMTSVPLLFIVCSSDETCRQNLISNRKGFDSRGPSFCFQLWSCRFEDIFFLADKGLKYMKAWKLLFIKGYFEKFPVKTHTFIDFKEHTGLVIHRNTTDTKIRIKTTDNKCFSINSKKVHLFCFVYCSFLGVLWFSNTIRTGLTLPNKNGPNTYQGFHLLHISLFISMFLFSFLSK